MLYFCNYIMKLVKLNAINSTNAFLKDMAKHKAVENFTVVVAKNQTAGKGQFDNKWQSEKGKNLTFSILCDFESLKIIDSFYLNCSVSLAVFNVLVNYIPERLKIKWPNDIMSASKKVCGILIENTVSKGKITRAIIGIGLNVNQEEFKNLPNASSLKIITGNTFDKELLLEKIVIELKKQVTFIESGAFEQIKEAYEQFLYKINTPSMYEDVFGNLFMGKILGVNQQGKLLVELEDETHKLYDLKEIKFL